jgi:hypothetical protein
MKALHPYFLLPVLLFSLLNFSCSNAPTTAWQSDLVNCWQVDSLYFRAEADEDIELILMELQAKAKGNIYFEFLDDGQCRYLWEGELLKGRWMIQEFYLKMNLENGSENYLRIVELKAGELIVEFPLPMAGTDGKNLLLLQKMKPCKISLDELKSRLEEKPCGRDPFETELRPFTAIQQAYFDIPTAESCAKMQNKPILYCYLNNEEKRTKMFHYGVLALPRLQKFMQKELVTVIHFTDLSPTIIAATDQSKSQADSLEAWSAQAPFFVLRDPQSLELIDSLSNPKDDIEFKRFLIEGLERYSNF